MEQHDAVVIGAGQAGLAVSRELGRLGVDHAILERERAGSSWTHLWDSFRLNTPNWGIRLPDLTYDGDDPDGFMARDDAATLLASYAENAPGELREGVDVTGLASSDGGLRLTTSEGPITARAVVVCTGAYQTPFVPATAGALPARIQQLHPRIYRNPSSIADGTTVIVGTAQSGCQIAEELLDAGRQVVVSCGRAPWSPRRIGDHDLLWWNLETGFLDQPVSELPTPAARFAANVTASGVDGGHDLHARTLRAKGALLVGRFVGHRDGSLRFANDLGESIAWGDARYLDLVAGVEKLCRERGMAVPDMPEPEPFDPSAPTEVPFGDVGAVVFATGFRPAYGWIDDRRAFDAMGFPLQRDGASDIVPGLFFAGVHFLRRRRSSLLCGVGDDAAVVADGVAAHLGATSTSESERAGRAGRASRPERPGSFR